MSRIFFCFSPLFLEEKVSPLITVKCTKEVNNPHLLPKTNYYLILFYSGFLCVFIPVVHLGINFPHIHEHTLSVDKSNVFCGILSECDSITYFKLTE